MITVNLRYMGTNGNARKFAEEMMASGTVGKIRAEEGNLRYEYYYSLEEPERDSFHRNFCGTKSSRKRIISISPISIPHKTKIATINL